MSAPTLTPAAFAAKWRGSTTTEKAAAQEHFIDLCRMVGEPTPNEADPTGDQYAFERPVAGGYGGGGFAAVWRLMAGPARRGEHREEGEQPT